MKNIKWITAGILALAAIASPLATRAQEKKVEVKPYPLDTCIVTDEKLGSMGKAFVFTNDTREFKLCCKSCKKDFDKDTAKFVKKLEEAEKKAAAKPKPAPAPGHEGHNH